MKDGAYAEFADNRRGSITPGKLADLIILNQDIFRVPAKEIRNTRIEVTIMDGEVVFEWQ